MGRVISVARALVVLIGLYFGCTDCTSAAELVKSKDAACDTQLEGEIKVADADRFKTQLETIESLCLNSPGGSFLDGVKLFELIADNKIATIIRSNDACFSACAVAFMGGSGGAYGDRFPNRTVNRGGQLGFHSPFVDPANSRVATELNTLGFGFMVGIKVVVELLRADKFDIFPKSLLAEMLDTAPSSLYYIDTFQRVVLANIALGEISTPSKITKRMLFQACLNNHPWYRNVNEAASNNEAKQSEVGVLADENRYRIIFRDFGLMGMENCVVDVIKNGLDTEIHINIGDRDLHQVVVNSKKVPAWVLFPRNQKISDLPPLSPQIR